MVLWINKVLTRFGYIGVAFLIFLENIFPPIPSEIILTFVGFLSLNSSLRIEFLILFSTIASLLGAYFLYFIGSLLDEKTLLKFVHSKYGKILGFKEKELIKTLNLFYSKGIFIVFLGRCIPIIRSLISIPAGMSHMNLFSFTIYTTIGSLIWNTILIISGRILNENWMLASNFISSYSHIIAILCILLLLCYFLKKIGDKNRLK